MLPPSRIVSGFTVIGRALPLAGLLLASAAPAPAAAQRRISREQEINLALSALPEHLRDGAGVYVLGPAGFEPVRQAGNGFNCLVERDDGHTLAPVCFDREGSETTLRTVLRRGRLRQAGQSEEEIKRTIDAEYRRGNLVAPRRPGIAYMLSPEFTRVDPRTGKVEQVFPPHLMFYAPNLTNADIGATDEDFGSLHRPWILGEGPEAVIIVVPGRP